MGGANLEGGRSGLSSGKKGSRVKVIMEVERWDPYLNYYLRATIICGYKF